MSDSEYESELESLTAERPVEQEKKSTKQKRTPAQKRALEKARLARVLKAERKRIKELRDSESSSLYYLLGLGACSAAALAYYSYEKQFKKQEKDLQEEHAKSKAPLPFTRWA